MGAQGSSKHQRCRDFVRGFCCTRVLNRSDKGGVGLQVVCAGIQGNRVSHCQDGNQACDGHDPGSDSQRHHSVRPPPAHACHRSYALCMYSAHRSSLADTKSTLSGPGTKEVSTLWALICPFTSNGTMFTSELRLRLQTYCSAAQGQQNLH